MLDKYTNFVDTFLLNLVAQLLKYTEINNTKIE